MTNMKERPCGDPHVGVGAAALKDRCSSAFELKRLRSIPLVECLRACGTGDLETIAGMTRDLREFGDQVRGLRSVLDQLQAFKREKFDSGDEKAMRIPPDEMKVHGLWRELTEIESALHSAHAVAHVSLRMMETEE